MSERPQPLPQRPTRQQLARVRSALRGRQAQMRRVGYAARTTFTKPDLPTFALPDVPPRRSTRVAVILDPFSELAFRYEWNQVTFGPEDRLIVIAED